MSLERRVRDLEGGHARCSACGIGLHSPAEVVVDLDDELVDEEELIAWYKRGAREEDLPEAYRDPEPERCQKCGRPKEVVIDWDDAVSGLERARCEAKMLIEKPWERFDDEHDARYHPLQREAHTWAESSGHEVPNYPPEGPEFRPSGEGA